MKKLEDIPASAYGVAKFAEKMTAKEQWVFSQNIDAFAGAGKKYDTIVKQSNGNWFVASKATGVQLVCDNVHESGTVLTAYAFLVGNTEAQKMFFHYLTGNAEEVEVNTAKVFSDDEGVRQKVYSGIIDALNHGKGAGSINVLQQDYTTNKWLYAFGRINVHWKLVNGRIELSIQDLYKWHPLQGRITQCLHQAMEKASQFGAKEFPYHCTTMTVSIGNLYAELEKLKKFDLSDY
jgi:hypothetical protein